MHFIILRLKRFNFNIFPHHIRNIQKILYNILLYFILSYNILLYFILSLLPYIILYLNTDLPVHNALPEHWYYSTYIRLIPIF